jgi:hypothetical protein
MKLQITGPNDQASITVPKKFVKAKGWDNKEELEWKINDKGNLELTEK